MTPEQQQLEAAIAALVAQRAMLGDAVVELATAPLRAQLAALLRPAGVQLRQVTVLFADVVGSTAMAQGLAAEDTLHVLGTAMHRMAAVVLAHQGRVLRFTGDGIKAAFGMDEAREDDAERAVRAGLALLEAGRVQAEEALAQHGVPDFAVRVGLHTGDVALGAGIDADNTAVGLAVNVAARMEQTALPGTLRISHDTWSQVRGLFQMDEQPPLVVKGVDAPMVTYLVRAALERSAASVERGLQGLATPMVGRDAELKRLLDAAALARQSPQLQALTLLGEAGLGKSRLLREFTARLVAAGPAEAAVHVAADAAADASAYFVLALRSQPDGLLRLFGLLRSLLAMQCGVADSDSADVARGKVVQGLSPSFSERAEPQAQLIAHLAGLDFSASPHIRGQDPRSLRDQAFTALRRYLQALAAQGPLPVLIVEDLHWADDGSLDWLSDLLAHADELPLLLVMTARPALLLRRPGWAAPESTLTLQALPAAQGAELAQALLQRIAEVPAALSDLITRRAEGNPYYMEELVRRLIDDGVIDATQPQWTVQADRLDALRLPTTLVGLLQARLDALPAGERQAARQASIVGHVFWDDALQALDANAPQALPALQRAAIVRGHGASSIEGTAERQFDHHLLHQVTYDTLLKAERRLGHGAAARWLQERSQGRENEMAAQIAEHFELAGDGAQALSYWLRAAEDAARREADTAALAQADRALALDDGSDLRRLVRLHRVRSGVFLRAGDSAAHGHELGVLLALTERLDDDVLRLSLANDQMWRLFLQARYEEAVALGEQRLVQSEARAPGEAARVHNICFIALSRLGRTDEALSHAKLGLVQAQAAGKFETVGAIHTNLGIGHLDACRYTLARESLNLALGAYQAAGSRSGVNNVRLNLAHLEQTLGLIESARDLLVQAVQELRDIASGRLEGIACGNLGTVLCELGDHQSGHEYATRGLRLAHAAGDVRAGAFAHHAAQLAARLQGRWADALEHARAASAGFREHAELGPAWANAGAVAICLHALGDINQALAQANELLAEVAQQGGWGAHLEAAFAVHEVLASLGDERTDAVLAQAHAVLCAEADKVAEFVSRDEFMRATMAARGICAAWAARAAHDSAPSA